MKDEQGNPCYIISMEP